MQGYTADAMIYYKNVGELVTFYISVVRESETNNINTKTIDSPVDLMWSNITHVLIMNITNLEYDYVSR